MLEHLLIGRDPTADGCIREICETWTFTVAARGQ